jgi:ribosomal-protein-alanine N-acetyltransferase
VAEAVTGFNAQWRPPTLRTRRLYLRELRESDLPEVFRMGSHPRVASRLIWDTFATRDSTLNYFVHDVQEQYRSGVGDPFAVCLHDGPLIGLVGARWAERKFLSMEFHYWLGEEYWGRGYATEAGRAALDWVFDAYVVERVQAHCVTDNIASARVMQKLGMRFEGVARSAVRRQDQVWDVAWYAVLRSDRGDSAGDATAAGRSGR